MVDVSEEVGEDVRKNIRGDSVGKAWVKMVGAEEALPRKEKGMVTVVSMKVWMRGS